MAPRVSKVRKYTQEEYVNGICDIIQDEAEATLGRDAWRWQLDATETIMGGDDVIIDVGTGCGKSLCFDLCLMADPEDVCLVVSPLSALMIDQARQSKIPAVAVCKETLRQIPLERLYEDIAQRKYRKVFVSPEILDSEEFRTQVLAKPSFYEHLRVAFIDEAHCISLWGGSFRPDYATLGTFRGRLPVNVPIAVASATLPDHIMDDIRSKLKLRADAARIAVTNARPNVALSVRGIKHALQSKADLRFLIPENAVFATDIPVTLVYCNSRTVVEDITDVLRQWLPPGVLTDEARRDCVAFYHAKIGEKRKRELEEKLRRGEVRILVCTDAVGMGCDMRNIERVILWGLPPSFCALVQRAGRAARNMTALGEAILFVSAKLLKDGITAKEVEESVETAVVEGESQNAELEIHLEDAVDEPQEGAAADVEVAEGRQRLLIGEGGVRVETAADEEEEDGEEPTSGVTGRKASSKKGRKGECNEREALFLTRFATTTTCRRSVWDTFFKNRTKLPLNSSTSTYRPIPNQRCCDRCTPDRFPIEPIRLENKPGLKRGRKKKLDPMLESAVREALQRWRVDYLLPHLYPSSSALIPSSSLMGDEIIEQLATCGERITTGDQLCRRTRWEYAYTRPSGTTNPNPERTSRPTLSDLGEALLQVLSEAYTTFDVEQAQQDAAKATVLPAHTDPIPASRFYATRSAPRPRTKAAPSTSGLAPQAAEPYSSSSDDEPLRQKIARRG